MNTTEGTTGVAWAGAINGWNNTSNPMSDDDMDGVYEVTISLPAGDHEYKFIQNADWGLAESFNGSESCTTPPAEFVNRVVTVTGAAMLDVVCYNSCDDVPNFSVARTLRSWIHTQASTTVLAERWLWKVACTRTPPTTIPLPTWTDNGSCEFDEDRRWQRLPR